MEEEEGVADWGRAGTRRHGQPARSPESCTVPEVSLQGESLPVTGAQQVGWADGAPLASFASALACASAEAKLGAACCTQPCAARAPPRRSRFCRLAPAAHPVATGHAGRTSVHSCGWLQSKMGAGKCQEEPCSLGSCAEAFGSLWIRPLQARLPEMASVSQQGR